MNKRYYLYCAESGCVWAAIAFVLGYQWIGQRVFAGMAVSPVIGVLMGIVFRPMYSRKTLGRVFGSLLTLYLAVALFALAVGAYELLLSAEHRMGGAHKEILRIVLMFVGFITWPERLLGLWTLSFANHTFLGRFAKAA